MIYTNDESDKSIRRKNYLFTVYLLPLLAAAVVCLVVYMAARADIISGRDAGTGYLLLSWSVAYFIYESNKRDWLKMLDGTHFNIKKNISFIENTAGIEPIAYEKEFYISKKNKIILFFLGISAIAGCIFILFTVQDNRLFCVMMAAMGIHICYRAIKELRNNSPSLKLAKAGLWTRQLGFVSWNDIENTKVVEADSGRQLILKIYKKNTVFAQAGQPDEKLYLTVFDNKDSVEPMINDLKNKYSNYL